ncbi:hypothetical protein [Bilophila wadsworthia]|uniref:hypothetical protein n=1 Tax=Bilophila wadsworthia TaxID=35833 RepID=UPI00300F3F6E
MVNIPVGWWILKGAGEFFPCSPEAFNDAYCPVPATEIEQEWHFGQGGLYINDARGRNLFYACLADFRQMQLAMAAPELYAVLSEMVNIGYKHEEGCWPSEGQHTEGCLKKQAALNKARAVLGGSTVCRCCQQFLWNRRLAPREGKGCVDPSRGEIRKWEKINDCQRINRKIESLQP